LPGLAQSARSQAPIQPEAEGAEAIVKCHAQLYDLRVKDLQQRQSQNLNIEAGRGLIDLAAVFRALLKINHLKFIA
jgi:hypothetical protein